MNDKTLKCVWISLNDDNTYSINLDFDGCSITYPNTKIEFMRFNNAMFPVVVKIYDDNNNEVNEYSLSLKQVV